jgi:fructose-bisphosphate aldolase class II
MIESVKEILTKAREGGYAVGAFNTTNLETTKAIIEAAKEMRSPVIVQVTEKTMNYTGGRQIFNMIKNEVEFYAPEIPVGIHLDHGKSFEIVERAIEIGFTSVMYDGSRKEYVDNLATTKKIAEFSHERGIDIQAELGNVPYIGEGGVGEVDWDKYMTNPEQAKAFVEETGADTLAVAIGNAHGFFIEKETPDFERLAKIRSLIDVPIVLHGASDWEDGKAKKAIEAGVSCFNVDTATRMAFVNNLVKAVHEQKHQISFDLRKLLGDARESVREAVKAKIKLFGSDGKI